jgi:hypothetical protein
LHKYVLTGTLVNADLQQRWAVVQKIHDHRKLSDEIIDDMEDWEKPLNAGFKPWTCLHISTPSPCADQSGDDAIDIETKSCSTSDSDLNRRIDTIRFSPTLLPAASPFEDGLQSSQAQKSGDFAETGTLLRSPTQKHSTCKRLALSAPFMGDPSATFLFSRIRSGDGSYRTFQIPKDALDLPDE